mmetsp:Transcript_129019/g.251233  ORF Transcript_129019/g.251233 Transcript_129019/m.251233 type:complete len:203 (+) Transcript_129019:1-609(+)
MLETTNYASFSELHALMLHCPLFRQTMANTGHVTLLAFRMVFFPTCRPFICRHAQCCSLLNHLCWSRRLPLPKLRVADNSPQVDKQNAHDQGEFHDKPSQCWLGFCFASCYWFRLFCNGSCIQLLRQPLCQAGPILSTASSPSCKTFSLDVSMDSGIPLNILIVAKHLVHGTINNGKTDVQIHDFRVQPRLPLPSHVSKWTG